jgi:hypothetical protein
VRHFVWFKLSNQKFAGEKLRWQAAKTKNRKKISRRKFLTAARFAAPPCNPAAGNEEMPAPAFPSSAPPRSAFANPGAAAARHFFEDFCGASGFLCYIPTLLTNRI